VRLCLDEHYAFDIAWGLRTREHDACAVKERAEFVALGDAELLQVLIAERRALVTENVSDFEPLARELAASSQHHFGLVFTSPRSMPRYRSTIGMLIDRLDELMKAHLGEEDFRDKTTWLQP
jgi:Domain of unknown function (DUF5615)